MSLIAWRRPKKKRGDVILNLAAMMDIFTLLVFFLLMNTGQAELLSPPPEMKLPVSIAQTPPDPHLVVSITTQGVSVGGKPVMGLEALRAGSDDVLVPLRDALLRARSEQAAAGPDGAQLPVTILGDRSIPYEVLKRVMASCQAARFTAIDLAIKQARGAGAAS